MKNIVTDSMWAHLLMFWFMVDFLIELGGFALVVFGSFYVLLIFQSAINIANFEMSEVGQFVEKAGSGKYKHIEVRYFK